MKKSCKDCKERHIGCHSECEAYKKMKEKREEINKRRRLDSYTSGETGWNFSHKSKKNG